MKVLPDIAKQSKYVAIDTETDEEQVFIPTIDGKYGLLKYASATKFKKNKSRVKAIAASAGIIASSGALGLAGGGGAGAGIGLVGGPIGSVIGAVIGGVSGGIAGISVGVAAACATSYFIFKKSTQFQEWRANHIKEDIKKAFDDFLCDRKEFFDLCCPINGALMEKPVRAPDGKVYEEKAIIKWINSKPESALASPFQICDFSEKDLVYDYKTADKIAKVILAEVNKQLTAKLDPRIVVGLNLLVMDSKRDLDYVLECWMKELTDRREKEGECLDILLEKFAFLCHEFDLEPKNIHLKCQTLLKKEWNEKAKARLQYLYDNKEPKEYYEHKNLDKINT